MKDWIIALIIGGIIVFAVVVMTNASIKSSEERYNFYKEWCPKLNASFVEPIHNNSFFSSFGCFREKEGIPTFYNIIEVNKEYKLREKS